MRGLSLFITLVILSFVVTSTYAQSTEEIMSQGSMLLSNGAYDQAVTKFRKVIARDPGNFEAQFNLAFAYLNWGRNSNAVKEFKKALNINPRSADVWSNLAYAYENLGQSDKALNALYRAVENNPRNIQARINLATMYANKNRLGQAIAQYKQVIQIDGTNLDAHVNLAKCLLSQGKSKDAKHYLKGAIAINPNEAEAYWELGNILKSRSETVNEAISNYKKALALNPNAQNFYENYGLLLEDLWKKNKDETKRQEAIDVWKKSLFYINDALKKEKIQDRLDMLERGESPTGKATPEELFGSTSLSESSTQELENELDRDQKSDIKQIQVESYNVSDDLGGLDEEEESSFNFDMEKAIEKKREEKEQGE